MTTIQSKEFSPEDRAILPKIDGGDLLRAIERAVSETFPGFVIVFDQCDTGSIVEINTCSVDHENRRLVLW